jgi:long-chain fatty acid transport protein
MKKVLTCIGGTALSCAFAATVFAGAVENKTNWSAEYIRTLNRNAATDYADIAAYNPAGTVKLSEGFIINGSVQYLSKDYKNDINGKSYESDEPSYVPGIYGVYNRKKWSLFVAFSNVGGGGKVDYGSGNFTSYSIGKGLTYGADRQIDAMVQAGGGPAAPIGTYYAGTLVKQHVNAESYYLGYTFGGAYNFNDMVSVSLGARYVDATRKAKGAVTTTPTATGAYLGAPPVTAKVDYEQDDTGWTGIIGLNLAPNEAFNIGVRFETKTELNLESDVNKDNRDILGSLPIPIVDGKSVARDLPPLLGLGVSYRITPKLRTEVNLTYYFNENADWDRAEDNVDNGYDVGIALEYLFNDKLTGSVGYMHTKLGMDPEYMLPENPELDANTIGAGIAYAFNEKFHTNFSIGNSFYEDDSFKPQPGTKVKYEKNIFFMALGLEFRFL